MSSPQKKILELKDLSVWRGIPILQSISWKIKKGDHWVILGANGSGKSTLLGALTAYITPTSGEMTILNQSYGKTDWRELRKKVGMVSTVIHSMIQPEESALKLVLSGKDAMINYWGKISSKDLKKARGILRQISASHLEERTWAELSQGERQRILIGRAFMANYKILILDEPCAGMDLAAREHFLKFLGTLLQRKKTPTFLFVTHHIEEIIPSMNKVLLLHQGKVFLQGDKSKILNAKNLSTLFGEKIKVEKKNQRYYAKTFLYNSTFDG